MRRRATLVPAIAVIASIAVSSSAGPVAAGGGERPRRAGAIVRAWTVEEQIGQLVLFEVEVSNPRYEPGTGSPATAVEELETLQRTYHLAGFTLEEGNEALYLDAQMARLRRADADGVRPFLAVNEEGGPVQVADERTFDPSADWIGCTNLGPLPGYVQHRPVPWEGFTCVDPTWPAPGTHTETEDLRYFPYLRNAFAMASGKEPGERWTPEETRDHLEDVGRALVRIHVDLDLAPVLGISNGTTATSLLGDRVFADDPATVVEYATAFSEGVQRGSDGRVGTVVKHFPGLGTVVSNTDDAPGVSAPLEQLRSRDLLPYEHLDAYRPLAVMMSNAAVPGLTCPADATPDECIAEPPATLQPAAYELLRSEPYGWRGVIVTDTLAGGSVIYGGRTIEQAAREAVAAGADLIEIKPVPPANAPDDWFPTVQDNVATIEASIAAIREWAGDDADRLAQIRASARRVVKAKQRLRS